MCERIHDKEKKKINIGHKIKTRIFFKKLNSNQKPLKEIAFKTPRIMLHTILDANLQVCIIYLNFLMSLLMWNANHPS